MKIKAKGIGAVAGIILAGGLSRRMGGGDKTLQPLGEKPILAHIIERFSSQVDDLAINANGSPHRFQSFGLEIVPDLETDFAGPLAGVLAGMTWARKKSPDFTHLVTVPGDAPFIPSDLADRLIEAALRESLPLATAMSEGRTHPVIGLWPLSLKEDLEECLGKGMRKIDLWTQRHGVAIAEFKAIPIDPFFNINTPEEREAALSLLKGF